MPALKEEIEKAEEEGIHFEFLLYRPAPPERTIRLFLKATE